MTVSIFELGYGPQAPDGSHDVGVGQLAVGGDPWFDQIHEHEHGAG